MLTSDDYSALAEFRFQIRHFLRFSELAAHHEGLEAQQHQLLLAVRSLDHGAGPTVGALADHLLIRHHSAVGLIDRLEERGLIHRIRGTADRRQVRIKLTTDGEAKLERLSMLHRAELRTSGPRLVESLSALLSRLSVAVSADSKEDDVPAAQERHS